MVIDWLALVALGVGLALGSRIGWKIGMRMAIFHLLDCLPKEQARQIAVWIDEAIKNENGVGS
jgi:hypothetical protein